MNKREEQKDNDTYAKNFTRVPNILFESYQHLTKEEVLLYIRLRYIYWDTKPRYLSLRDLANMTGYSTGALSKMLPRLNTVGLVHAEIKRKKDRDGKEKGNPLYHITINDIWEENRRFFNEAKFDPSDALLVHQMNETSSPNEQDTPKPVHQMNKPVHKTNDLVHQTVQGRSEDEQDQAQVERGNTLTKTSNKTSLQDGREDASASTPTRNDLIEEVEKGLSERRIAATTASILRSESENDLDPEKTRTPFDRHPRYTDTKEQFRQSSAIGDVTQADTSPSQQTPVSRASAGASQPSLRMRDGPAPMTPQQEVNAHRRQLWAVIEEVTEMEFSRTTRESKHNKPGIENLIQDGISDEKLRKALKAMMDSSDAWLRTNFNVSLFHERIPGLLKAQPGQERGKPVSAQPHPTEVYTTVDVTRNQRNIDRLKASAAARAAQKEAVGQRGSNQ